MKKILVVDDHNLIYNGLNILLKKDFFLEYSNNLSSARKRLDSTFFDLIIIDITLGNESGFDLVDNISDKQTFYFLSMHKSSIYIDRAINVGAAGYFLKDEPVEYMVDCLKRTTTDEFIMSKTVKNELSNLYKGENSSYDELTPREQQIFYLIADGLSYKEIAYQLKISAKTVNNHRTNIMNKLNIQSVPELIKLAYKLGII